MERHETAKQARREFGAVLDRLKAECGIERQKVADILGINPSHLSRMSAEEVKDRPTFAPPDGWQSTLAAGLRSLGTQLHTFAADLGSPS